MKTLLFFDTETTGLPPSFSAPLEYWPRLVQLAWIEAGVHEDDPSRWKRFNFIIRPDGFTIPEASSSVHGITTERALKEGHSLPEVLILFRDALDRSAAVICHNTNFDVNVMDGEYARIFQETPVARKKQFCTVKRTTNILKLPNTKYPGKYKWPNLQELHSWLFGSGFEDAHDAMIDVEITAKCFYELKRRNLLKKG